MLDRELLAYLAGCIDSDGCISIKKSTYHQRVRKEATNPVYSERVMLKQVTPQVPELLRDTFGGYYFTSKGREPNNKPLFGWQVTDTQAANAARLLRPFLRIKHPQADLVLELRASKQPPYGKLGYWFHLDPETCCPTGGGVVPMSRICRLEGCSKPCSGREHYCSWKCWDLTQQEREARKPAREPRLCKREDCSTPCTGREHYCSARCYNRSWDERAKAHAERRRAAIAEARGVVAGQCERPGCTEPKEQGRLHLCAFHGRTYDLIASQRVPKHRVTFRGPDLVATCPRCSSVEILATHPDPKEVRRARSRAQVWACEHTCQEVTAS